MEWQVGLVRWTRWPMGSSASRAVQDWRAKVVNMGRCKVVVEPEAYTRGLVVCPQNHQEDGFLVWAAKPSPEARGDGDGDPGASGSFEAGGTWRDRGVCVDVKRSRGGSVSVR